MTPIPFHANLHLPQHYTHFIAKTLIGRRKNWHWGNNEQQILPNGKEHPHLYFEGANLFDSVWLTLRRFTLSVLYWHSSLILTQGVFTFIVWTRLLKNLQIYQWLKKHKSYAWISFKITCSLFLKETITWNVKNSWIKSLPCETKSSKNVWWLTWSFDRIFQNVSKLLKKTNCCGNFWGKCYHKDIFFSTSNYNTTIKIS